MSNHKMQFVKKVHKDYQKEVQKEIELEERIKKLGREMEIYNTETKHREIHEEWRRAHYEYDKTKQTIYVLAKLIVENLPESIFAEEESHDI